MRIIHTADWHLGRLFHGASLVDDQAYVLEDLVRLVDDQKADVLIIAGDVFDRRQPPDSAVELLDQILSQIVIDLDTTVLMIAGNHDSGTRLAFGSSLLSSRQLHVRGPCSMDLDPVQLSDDHGSVDFCLLPYEQAEPLSLRTTSGDSSIRSFDQAMAYATQASFNQCQAYRRVAIAHCYTAGGDVSDSERPLSIGGSDQVSPKHFEKFNYTALGHLHRPQTVVDGVAYSGSLLKYSFSEAMHKKSVSVVDLDAHGLAAIETMTLRTRRDLRIIEGSLNELLENDDSLSKDDHILARLTDTGALHDPLARLRIRYPNIAQIERPRLFHNEATTEQIARETLKRTDSDIFEDFYRQVTENDLTASEKRVFESSLAEPDGEVDQ